MSSTTIREQILPAAQAAEQPLLRMWDVYKAFGEVKALEGARLLVRPHSVHGLVGENGAGKSTLMKCLFGIYSMDSGGILLRGKPVTFTSTRQAMDGGVSMVQQEIDQVRGRSVMENVWLGRFPRRGIVVDDKKMFEDTKRIFADLNLDLDPKEIIGRLSVSQRQMVEIAKAVSMNAQLIVLDEPTTSLTEKEIEQLFTIVRGLRERGCGIIYISHKMEEVLTIADEVTIMRDGKWIATERAADLTVDKLISLMVGRELHETFPSKDNHPGEIVLSVRNLTATYQPSVIDASFELRAGEILGIAGLLGSRRTELLELLFGLRRREHGEIVHRGKAIANNSVGDAIANGFSMVTEDRRLTGIFPALTVRFNTIVANLRRYVQKTGNLDEVRMAKDTQTEIDSLRIKTPSQTINAGSLSGGNQQKVILGRWLLTDPDILMLDEPTKGIDVGTKYHIYELIIELARRGKGIIFVSSELRELLGITDRILVMSNGRVAGIVETAKTDQEELLKLATRYL